MATKKTKCIFCGGEKSKAGFFTKSDSSLLADDLSICKTCAKKIGKIEELSTIHFILRLLDKPFINSAWQDALVNRPNEPLGKYLSLICGSQYKDYITYDDGEQLTDGIKFNAETVNEEELSKTKTQLLKEWEQFWGHGFEFYEYEFLENELANWKKTHKCDNQAEITLLKEICIKILELRRDREKDGKNTGKLQKELQDLMKTASVDPAKSNAISGAQTVDRFGMWLKDIEEFKPSEWWENQEKYKDMDGFLPYIKNYIVRPIKNFFTGRKDFMIDGQDLSFKNKDDKGDNNG